MWQNIAAEAITDYKAQHLMGELDTLLCLLDTEIMPRTVVEIGTADGGSAWAWSKLSTVSHIITVDISPPPRGWQSFIDGATVTQVHGDSHQADIADRVKLLYEPVRPALVFIDGAHDYESARRDWELYAPMAAPGGVIVLHDTQGWPGRTDFGVGQLWSEITKDRRHVELVSQPGGPGGTGIVWA